MIPSASDIKTFIQSNRALVSLGSRRSCRAGLCHPQPLRDAGVRLLHVKGPEALGLIMSTFLLTEAVSRPVFGALGDKLGRKPLLIAGPRSRRITSYLTIVIHGPWAVFGWLL